MNLQSILFATDFSHDNDAALEYASTLAAEAGAMLYIVHVHELQDLSTTMGEASYMYAVNWQEELEKARKRLGMVVPTVRGVEFEHHCLRGRPDDEIVAFAAENSIDLIVMASHGRTGLSRLLMGSVAEGVMRRAPCPVLIVKQPVSQDEDSAQPCSSSAKKGMPK